MLSLKWDQSQDFSPVCVIMPCFANTQQKKNVQNLQHFWNLFGKVLKSNSDYIPKKMRWCYNKMNTSSFCLFNQGVRMRHCEPRAGAGKRLILPELANPILRWQNLAFYQSHITNPVSPSITGITSPKISCGDFIHTLLPGRPVTVFIKARSTHWALSCSRGKSHREHERVKIKV